MQEHATFKFLPPGEPIKGKTYRADGYAYKDLPKMNKETMDKFKSIFGEENIVWITKAEYDSGYGYKLYRGQILVSPNGLKKAGQYFKAKMN